MSGAIIEKQNIQKWDSHVRALALFCVLPVPSQVVRSSFSLPFPSTITERAAWDVEEEFLTFALNC